MSIIKRKWSEAQKLAIIQEAEQNGITEIMRKHNLSHSLYRKWRKAYNGEGMPCLQPKYKTVDPAVKQLEVENQRLKNIIVKMALEIEFKSELLKKVFNSFGHKKFDPALQNTEQTSARYSGGVAWLPVATTTALQLASGLQAFHSHADAG